MMPPSAGLLSSHIAVRLELLIGGPLSQSISKSSTGETELLCASSSNEHTPLSKVTRGLLQSCRWPETAAGQGAPGHVRSEQARGRASPASLSDNREDGGDVHTSSHSLPPATLGHTCPGEQDRVAFCVTGSSEEGSGLGGELWVTWG